MPFSLVVADIKHQESKRWCKVKIVFTINIISKNASKDVENTSSRKVFNISHYQQKTSYYQQLPEMTLQPTSFINWSLEDDLEKKSGSIIKACRIKAFAE